MLTVNSCVHLRAGCKCKLKHWRFKHFITRANGLNQRTGGGGMMLVMLHYTCTRKAAAQCVESQLALSPMGLGYVNMVLWLAVEYPGVISRELREVCRPCMASVLRTV